MKTKIKSVLQKIMAGALALVFACTIALPKAKAVTGVDDVSVGIMAVLVHLESIGGSLAVQQGTALATQNAVTALAAQAGAAGALGAGVTGTAALATIGGAVTVAAAGGFTIGYVGYQQLSKLAEWIRQAKLTGTAENKIYQTGGKWDTGYSGSTIYGKYNLGDVISTEAGTTFWIDVKESVSSPNNFGYEITAINSENNILQANSGYYPTYYVPSPSKVSDYRLMNVEASKVQVGNSQAGFSTAFNLPYDYDADFWRGYFAPNPDVEVEKREVVYVPPVTWAPPAPTTGQDVYYNPYPNAPNKPIKEIVEDVPKDIYDKKFDPAPPSILDPSVPPITPPAPDIPTVNPNPDVTAPDDVKPYTVRLGDVFPFCIPFDIYHMVTLFAAEPEAPHAKWEFSLPFTGGTYEIEWDLREWDEVAALCRKLELILFCVGLAVVTSKLIKW